MVMAYQPGDEHIRLHGTSGQHQIPRRRTRTAEHSGITFAPIAGPGRSAPVRFPLQRNIRLRGLPVEFCVIDGPVDIEGNTLTIDATIPPRTKMPVKVTVTAYQWGRSIEPLVQERRAG